MSMVRHTVDFHVKTHWARMNTLSWDYYHIAELAYHHFLDARENAIPLPEEGDPTEYFEGFKKIREYSFQTIVFSAMACEAAIYDLAAIQLGDDYVTKYLDKLDIVAKWIVVPSLICGKSLKIDGPAINGLRSLIRLRNALVHHKSLPALNVVDTVQRADKQIEKIIKGTDEAFKTVVLLSLELNRILEVRSGILPFFEEDTIFFSESKFPSSIMGVICRCREVDEKNAF